ncbi:NAD-dependent epimerase/dehydratase family protein [Paenibacillus sepulcri]|uniref:NAD(P)-dependent oxidoreductase n=1 Tax=Paenibacillus sepulcri TaxID=359917 RepID=A0ABS7BXQ7_9BACL|nr:NAD(P)-dependent oxidoreductase [Paenibacillus sepulcri]
MKIFVTGGTGNIGQNVTKALLAAGHEIVLLTRTPDRIPYYQTLPNITLVQGNILELDVMEKALQGCDAVIHVALGWGNDPVEMLEHDTKVTLFLADAAERAGLHKFIYTSSTAAMGDLRDGMDETAQLLPGNLYGATKAASEMYLMGFNRYYNGQGVNGTKTKIARNVIRPGYIFSNPAYEGGASQSDVRFLNLAKAVLQNEDLTFNKFDGTQFLSGRQIAELYVKLLESDFNNETFMALGKKFVSWAEIAQLAIDLTGSSSKIIISNADEERKRSYYNASKMEIVFGLSFEGDEDLKDHIQWNIDRARKILAGEQVHDVYHVW